MDYFAEYLPYYILFLAILALYGCIGATVIPAKIRNDMYLPHVNVPPAGIRLHTPWYMISTLIRIFAFLNFNDKSWYDATLITLTAPLWYFPTEYFIYKTLPLQILLTSGGLDSFAFVWMLLARQTVTGG